MQFEPYADKPRWIHDNPSQLKTHEDDVQRIAAQVRSKFNAKEPFRIFHGSTNSTRQNVMRRSGAVDISSLNRVLRVDTERKVVLVEPNVAMDSLVQATLKYGLVPSVVTEFPGITVGGAWAGTAGESSSFKYGFFDRIVNEAEIILPNGNIIQASDDKHEDLFRKIPSTMGTLGITTALEIRLEKAKRYVKLTGHPVKSMDEAVSLLEKHTSDPDTSALDFVDGIMYSPTEGVIITGRSTESVDPGVQIAQFSRPWDPWFYTHIQDLMRQNPGCQISEFVPIADYLFRYDRGGFWVGRSTFKYFFFMPFNRLTRWFLDDFLHTRMLYRALHASKNVISYVVQDCAVPFKTASQFVKYTDKEFGIYPLWLCPLRQLDSKPTTFHPHECSVDASASQPEQMLNIGLWGFGPKKYSAYIEANVALERKLHELGGMKWLYSQTYYSEPEFWSIYKRDWYDVLRRKYHAAHLPSVWQKVRVDMDSERKEMKGSWWVWGLKIWPLAGLWGLWKAVVSRDWRIPKRVVISQMDPGKIDKLD